MDLFVYGTLRDADLRRAVLGHGPTSGDDGRSGDGPVVRPATLDGYRVHPLQGQVVPLIVTDPNARCDGLLIQDLSAAQGARIALYEGAFDYRLVDVRVRVDDQMRPAQMWIPPVSAVAGAGTWSLRQWQERYAAASVEAAQDLFAMDPLPSPKTLRWQFPMMQRRAWSRVRARQRAGPTTLRHAPRPGDVTVDARAAPLGRFFRLQGFAVTHRRFDGDSQGPLEREVFVGTEAVLVQPYDPRNDRVLLVEQVRMGPLELGDPVPWVLEPVAGMIDAFETPQDAALRETREEAGLKVSLRHVTTSYASPGNATDLFHCYAGLCDLPEGTTWTGGLDAEHEDLRLHTLSLDHALSLVDSGEINAAPAVLLLYWLALNRDRLRLEFAAREVS